MITILKNMPNLDYSGRRTGDDTYTYVCMYLYVYLYTPLRTFVYVYVQSILSLRR